MNKENRSAETEILPSEKDYKSLQADYTKTKQSLIDFGTELVKAKGDFEVIEDSNLKDKVSKNLYNISYEEYLGIAGDSKLKELNLNTNNTDNIMNKTNTETHPNTELDILKSELEQLKAERDSEKTMKEKVAFEKAFGSTLNSLTSEEEKESFNAKVQEKMELVNPNLDYQQKLDLVQAMLGTNKSNSVNALRDVNTFVNTYTPTQNQQPTNRNETISDEFKSILGL